MTTRSPLRVIVADDEPLARRRLRDLLDDAGGVSVVAECGDGTSVLVAIAATKPDVVLLDVRMPGDEGGDVAELVRAMGDDGPVLLLVTAQAPQVAGALDGRVAGHLLKPYSAARLARALDEARALLRARQERVSPPPVPFP